MKIYALDRTSRISLPVADALGLAQLREAGVMVAASTKADAFALLTERRMEPGNIRDLRVDQSTPTGQLVAAGLLPAGTVLAMKDSSNTPVVQVDSRDDFHQVAEFKRGNLLVSGSVPIAPDSYPEEAEMVLAQLAGANNQLNQLEAELARVRAERAELCRRAAYDLKIADRAAVELGVTPGRVYQLATKALKDRADHGEYLPGLLVQVSEPGLAPSRWPVATVVERPAECREAEFAGRVWVRYENGSVCPIPPHRLHTAVPSCNLCPPEKAPHGLSPEELSVHQLAQHGIERS